jgi:D-glycero-D-manno-heptose 1,7-bisphosphate phosphatase
MNKAVFLDRDGTINKDVNYLIHYEDLEFIQGVIQALQIFQDLGYYLFIITNQSGIARGYFSQEQVEKLHELMCSYLNKKHISIHAISYCPHHIEGSISKYAISCNCRKPKPGMIQKLQKKFDVDICNSFTIGDSIRDAQAGLAAGTQVALVKTGHPLPITCDSSIPVFNSLLTFAEAIQNNNV